MILLDLFLGFLRVGCFAFGGAYGAIPLIRDVALSYGWLDDEALACMIAVSESTPGPIMVNLATYVGRSQAGFWGALLATLAVVLPSFAVILLVAVLWKNLSGSRRVQALMRGLKPCMTGIVLATGVSMVLARCASPKDRPQTLLLTGILAAVLFLSKPLLHKKISPIALILVSAAAGAIVYGMI